MYDCAESQTRFCKAYISDCYGHLATALNKCKSADQQLLKRNILGMLDRVKNLLENEKPEEETNAVDQTDET